MKLLFRRKNKLPQIQKPLPALSTCIVMDLLGCASFLIPVFGEVFDLVWAPISAMIYMRMFGGLKGVFGGAFNFLEELLPGLDFIPTFTISWFLLYSRRNRQVLNIQPSR